MKSSGYLAGISLLLTFTLTAGFLSLDSAPAGNGQASAQEERHGGDIIFEVKKNKQKQQKQRRLGKFASVER